MHTLKTLVVVAVLSLAACSGLGADIEEEERALRDAGDGLLAAEVAHDVDAIASFWTEDAILQPANAPIVSGRDAIREFYTEMFAAGILKGMESTVALLDIAPSGDMAYQFGENRALLTLPGGEVVDLGKYLAVWKKVDGKWLVAALSFSSDAAPASPPQ